MGQLVIGSSGEGGALESLEVKIAFGHPADSLFLGRLAVEIHQVILADREQARKDAGVEIGTRRRIAFGPLVAPCVVAGEARTDQPRDVSWMPPEREQHARDQ